MSWLGVNLNTSLSSIKGQITSFTRDVLAEEDEIEDEDIEIRLPKKRIKEYETSIYMYQQELKELKDSRAEVEERLRAVDYNSLQKISSLQKQLSETLDELHQVKEKSTEWTTVKWEVDQDVQGGEFHSTQYCQMQGALYEERIALLQQQLEEERHRHEEEVLALQDTYRELRRISGQEKLSASSLPQESHAASKKGERAQEEKDGRIKQLQEEVSFLKNERESLSQEKEQLGNSLEDLDNQHQLIIDEILKSKKQLTKDLDKTKEELLKLKESNAARNPNEENEAGVTIEALTRENSTLHLLLEEKDEASSRRATELDQIAKDQVQRIDTLTVQLVEQTEKAEKAETEFTRLSNDAKQLDERCREMRETVPRLELELTELKKRDEALRYENETLQKRLSAKERDYDRQCHTIEGLKDKIVSQEEEILKFEAVLEEKNVEHTNTFHKLKQHEEMTRITLQELKEEKQSLERTVRKLEHNSVKGGEEKDSNSDNAQQHKAIIKDLLNKCTVQDPKELPHLVADLNSEVASLRCERDRWSEGLASTMQDLREAQQLIETLETEKADLERESEDLRDQLEELQYGERAPPEGSLTPRSLPTIEEEEIDGNATQTDEAATEGDTTSQRSKGESEEGGTAQLFERIDHLTSQVSSLGEAKNSLEAELLAVKEEKRELEKLFESLSGAAEDKNSMDHTCRNDSLLQQDPSKTQKQSSAEEEKAKLERQIAQMTNAMDKMHFDSAHLSSREEEYQKERATLRDQIATQNKTIHDYFYEIARLKAALNESSNASALLREYQEKLASVEAELDKAKGLVIYKDDQIDQLTQEIEMIGEIFNLTGIDRQRMYLHVKQEHFQLVSKLNRTQEELEALKEENEELRERAEDLENEERDKEMLSKLRSELETTNVRLVEAKNELEKHKEESVNSLKEKEKELANVHSEKEKLSVEKQELLGHLKNATSAKEALEQRIEHLIEKASHADFILKAKAEEMGKVEQHFMEKEHELEAKITSLEQTLSSKAKEIENLSELTTQNSFELEKWKSEQLENVQKECSCALSEAAKLNEDNESLKSQVAQFESERQQLIVTSTQKHKEALTYYQEIQRLSELLQKATKLQEECDRKKEELRKLNDELCKQQEMCKCITKERDQLRLANSSFNSQYEEKRKEMASLQDRERHLSQEVQRLKQHLVEIEETYTSEAVKSEEREAALRQSLARMHEKMASHSTHYSNANQKASAQLDSVQKMLQEAVYQRDEAKLQLQVSEEASLQHQEALIRLQQVLQDFQKNQTRDIAMATERERRKYEDERGKNIEMEHQLQRIKEKLDEAEVSSAASEALREELQAKEDTIIALKTQVHAIQLAAKRSQDQVALLQSSADGKVDKHLLRNLVVGYFATPSDKQREVLRVVAQVLDFSPEERARTGIDQQPGSWLNSIANFLAPPPSNIRVASKVDVLDHSSLSQAFIRFLEEESSPRTQPRLPAVQMAEEAHQKAQKKAQTKANSVFSTATGATLSSTPLSPPVSSITSAASGTAEAPNPLLLYSAASLPEDFPVISTPAVSTAAPIVIPQGATTVSTPKFLNNLLNSKETKEEKITTQSWGRIDAHCKQ